MVAIAVGWACWNAVHPTMLAGNQIQALILGVYHLIYEFFQRECCRVKYKVI